MPKPRNTTGVRGFCPELYNGTSLDASPGDGKDWTSIIPVRTGRWPHHTKAYRSSQTASAHVGSSYQKGSHKQPKKDGIEGKEDEEFMEGPALTRDNKGSDVCLHRENALPEKTEEGATEQNEAFLLRSPEIRNKRGLGEIDEVGLGNNSNPANETSLPLSSRIRKAP